MNAHRVLVLGVVAVIAFGAALWSSQTRRAAQEDVAAQPLVAGLEAGINDVSQLRIRTAGDTLQATLKRIDNRWVLAEKDNFPVDVNLLREYLVKLARAKRVEAKTDNPTLYDRLGVEEISAKEAGGTQIEIEGLPQPVKLILGRNVTRGSGTYARHVGEAQSWLTDADLAVERVAANWLQRDLIDIAAGRVQRVSVTPVSGPAISIVRAAAGAANDFALSNLPKGREPASDFVADATAGFLSGLRFDDVLRAADAAASAAGATQAGFATEDGISVSVTAWKVGEASHAQFNATLDEAVAAAFVESAQAKAVREHEAAKTQAASKAAADTAVKPAAETTTETVAASANAEQPAPLATTDPEKDREQRLAALRAEVETLNARFSGKTFVLPSFKAGNLHKSLEEYLKPKA